MFLLICRSLAIAIPALLLLPHMAVAQKKLDPDVEKILRERLDLLKQAAELTKEHFKNGKFNFDQVMQADKVVIEAELELAVSAADRIKALEKLVENTTSLEQLIEQRTQFGASSTLDLMTAKASRLRAQADLLSAKKGAAAR